MAAQLHRHGLHAVASTIPNRDARNIPLRVDLKQGTQSWKDEVLMIQEGFIFSRTNVTYQ